MRKIFIILGVGALLLVTAGFWLVSNVNSLVAGYKPQLEELLSASLKAPVSLGDIEAEIFPTLQLSTENLRIGALQESKPGGLTLGKLSLSLELFPLLSGQINATKLSIASPRITFVKSSAGVAIEGLPSIPTARDNTIPAAPSQVPQKTVAEPAGLPQGIELKLRQFSLTNGEFVLNDQTENKTYVIKQANLDAQLNLLGSKVEIPQATFSARALEQYDLALSAADSSFDLGQSLLQIGGAELSSPFGKVKLKGSYKLKQQEASFDIRMSDLKYKFGDLELQNGAGDLAIAADKNSQRFATSNIKANFNGEDLKLALSGSLAAQQLKVRDLKFSGFGGELSGIADYDLGAQGFACDFAGSNFDVEKVLSALKPGSSPVKGRLEKLAVKLNGKLGPILKESLNGRLGLLLKDGELIGVNFAGTVLKAVKDIPLVSGALYSRVPSEYDDEVSSQRTPIKEFSADFDLSQANLSTANLKLLSTIFSLDASGKVSFDMDLNLKSTIYFAAPFSQALTHGVKELAILLDQDKRLVLPLQVDGKVPQIIVLPDLSKLLKRGAQNLIRDKAGDILDRALGGGAKEGSKKGGLGGLLGF